MPKGKSRKTTTRKKKSHLEEGFNNFAEEIEAIGERIGRHFESDKKSNEKPAFGLFGPFLSSLVSIIFLAIAVWFINFINIWIDSNFLSYLYSFLFRNLGFFFLISIFFSYTNHFSKCYDSKYKIISPITTAIGIAIGFWIAGNILSIANLSLRISVLDTVAYIMTNSVFWILGLVIFIGYIIIIIKLITEMPTESRRRVVVKKSSKTKNAEIRRLYRSGKEKIVGGVCGGVAEYLGIDPVIIRLLWIAAFFAFGSGILIYIIAWIIIPRNPKHKWED